MRSLSRSEPAKKSGQNIPKNRCRTTIAERKQAGDAFEQRRLAGTIGPNQAEDLAGENTERYVREHALIAKGLADPLHGHQGVGVR